jgi:hypothetical protein
MVAVCPHPNSSPVGIRRGMRDARGARACDGLCPTTVTKRWSIRQTKARKCSLLQNEHTHHAAALEVEGDIDDLPIQAIELGDGIAGGVEAAGKHGQISSSLDPEDAALRVAMTGTRGSAT